MRGGRSESLAARAIGLTHSFVRVAAPKQCLRLTGASSTQTGRRCRLGHRPADRLQMPARRHLHRHPQTRRGRDGHDRPPPQLPQGESMKRFALTIAAALAGAARVCSRYTPSLSVMGAILWRLSPHRATATRARSCECLASLRFAAHARCARAADAHRTSRRALCPSAWGCCSCRAERGDRAPGAHV